MATGTPLPYVCMCQSPDIDSCGWNRGEPETETTENIRKQQKTTENNRKQQKTTENNRGQQKKQLKQSKTIKKNKKQLKNN